MARKISRSLVLAAAMTLAGAVDSQATAKTLVYNAYIPTGHTINKLGVIPFLKKIEEDTGGSVKFDFFAGGALASGKTTLNAIRTGAIDAGGVVDLYTPGDLPVSTMLSDLFLFGQDARVMAAAMNETVLLDCEECLKDYTEENVLPLGFIATPAYLLQCKQPVTSVEQIAGKKIRATGAMGVLAARMGGTPVNITSSEIYEAMQRGQVDCFMGAGAWLKNYALWEVTTHTTDLPLGTYHGSLTYNLNTKTWAGLTDSEKAAFIDNMPHGVRSIMEAYLQDEAEARAESEKHGVKWLAPDESLRKALNDARSKEAERVAKLGTDRSVKDADRIIAVFLDNVDKWTGIVADTGDDYDAYEAALKREIFDKVNF